VVHIWGTKGQFN